MDLESPLSPWLPQPSVPWGSSSDASWTNPKVTSKAPLAPPEPSRAPFLFGSGNGGDLPVRRHGSRGRVERVSSTLHRSHTGCGLNRTQQCPECALGGSDAGCGQKDHRGQEEPGGWGSGKGQHRAAPCAWETGPTQALSCGPCVFKTGCGPWKPRMPGEGRPPATICASPLAPRAERSRHTGAPSCFASAGPAQRLGGRTLKSPHGDPEKAVKLIGPGPGLGHALKVKACRKV